MRRIGDYSQADFEAMRLAEQMQSLSMEYINEAFFSQEDLGIDNLTLDNFMKELDKAQDGGPIASFELNRQLAKIIQSVVPQILNPPQPGAQGQQQQTPPGGS